MLYGLFRWSIKRSNSDVHGTWDVPESFTYNPIAYWFSFAERFLTILLHFNKLSLRVFNCRWAGIRDRYWSRRGRDVNSTVDPVRINWNQLMQRTFIVFMLALCVPYFFPINNSRTQTSSTSSLLAFFFLLRSGV